MKTINVIEAIFFAALDKQDAGDRAAYLDRACSGDADLRRCVEKLLNAQPKVGEFLQAPAAELPQTADSLPDERAGILIGPYKLLHEIGEGGMGTVWMADQDKPVKRRVALKVIKPGMDSRQVLARFEAERQALALMDHPNIAKVLDAGATANNRPYFVMELVKGQPITDFCDKNRLTPRERLELFVPVCHAIQHAHQKGIIHRDIKPSNVLVALYDGKPVPKVIDFGVAKATAEPLTEMTLFTRHGQVVGTFEYMSPEQATLDQIDVDTRSDVYSLGVLLYELLTGTTPLEKERLRQAGLAEVLRLIREEEPPKPSTRLTSSPGLLSMAAAFRKSDSQKLPGLVRGELDWIVMKALDKDRERRFVTPSGLARDIERHLNGETVTACPPTLGYRARKYARKNKALFVTGTAVAAALVVGLALASWQAVRATNAKRETAAALDDALRIGHELDARLIDIEAANARISAGQVQQRADQYAWDMRSLPLIWESGNAVEAKRLLERQPPKLRGFEWNYWDHLTHSELLSVQLPVPAATSGDVAEWTFSGDGTRLAFTHWPRSSGGRSEEPNPQEIVLTVWDLATRKVVRTHRFAVVDHSRFGGPDRSSTQLSSDGKRVLVTQSIWPKPSDDGSTQRGDRVVVFDVERDQVLLDRAFQKDAPFSVFGGFSLSPDGRKLVASLTTTELAVSAGGTVGPAGPRSKWVSSEIQVFDLEAGDKEPLTIPDLQGSVSPDGTRIVGRRPDRRSDSEFGLPRLTGDLQVLDANTGKELSRFKPPTATALHLTPDGKELFGVLLADGEKSDRLLLKSWSAETGKERLAVPLPFPARSATRRDPETGERETVYLPVASMQFSRDGAQLIVVPGLSPLEAINEVDAMIVVDTQTGKVRARVETFSGASSPFQRARGGRDLTRRSFFSADGKQIIVREDNAIRAFDAATGKPVLALRHDKAVADCAEDPDGRLWSVEPDGMLRQWSLEPPEPVRIGTLGANAIVFPVFAVSADGGWVARARTEEGANPDEDRSIVEVWDTAGQGSKVFQKVGPRGGNRRVGTGGFQGALERPATALSADGRRVALLRPAAFPPPAKDEKDDPANPRKPIAPADLTVWDAGSGEEIYRAELSDPTGAAPVFSRPMLSPDGAHMVVLQHSAGQRHPVLRLFDIQNRREIQAIDLGEGVLSNMRFSPDGQRLATIVSERGPIKLSVYDVSTGKGRAIDARVARNSVLTWSPDGTRLLVTYTSGNDYEINLYDTTTGKPAGSLYTSDRGARGGDEMGVFNDRGPVFSPDGQRVAGLVQMGRSAVIKVWDADSGKDLLAIPAPPSPRLSFTALRYVRFSPDNNRLVLVTTQIAFAGGNFANTTPAPAAISVTTYDATPRADAKGP